MRRQVISLRARTGWWRYAPGVHGAAGAVISVLHHDTAIAPAPIHHLPVLHQRAKASRAFCPSRVVGVQRQRLALLTGGDQLAAVSIRAILPVMPAGLKAASNTQYKLRPRPRNGSGTDPIGIGCRHWATQSPARPELSAPTATAHSQRRQHATPSAVSASSAAGEPTCLPRHLRGGAVGAKAASHGGTAPHYIPLSPPRLTSLRAFFYHIYHFSRKECRDGRCPSESAAPYMPWGEVPSPHRTKTISTSVEPAAA